MRAIGIFMGISSGLGFSLFLASEKRPHSHHDSHRTKTRELWRFAPSCFCLLLGICSFSISSLTLPSLCFSLHSFLIKYCSAFELLPCVCGVAQHVTRHTSHGGQIRLMRSSEILRNRTHSLAAVASISLESTACSQVVSPSARERSSFADSVKPHFCLAKVGGKL